MPANETFGEETVSDRLKTWIYLMKNRNFTATHAEVIFLTSQWPSNYERSVTMATPWDESVISLSVTKGPVYLKTRTFAQLEKDGRVNVNYHYKYVGVNVSQAEYMRIVVFAVNQKGKPSNSSLWSSMVLWGMAREYRDSWNCFSLTAAALQCVGVLEERNPWLVTMDELEEFMTSDAMGPRRAVPLATPALSIRSHQLLENLDFY